MGTNTDSADDLVFRAMADPTRRFLLDQVFLRGGQTLSELESGLAMSRYGVMKHLRVLEEAGLVVTRRSGREKHHFLNPVPVRLVHDRWIDKFTEGRVSLLADLSTQLEGSNLVTTTNDAATTQVFRVHIKAPVEAVWKAITDPAWSARYGYGAMHFDLRPGGTFRGMANDGLLAMGAPETVVEGEVIEADPPHRLVQTYHMTFDPAAAAEPATTVTWTLEALQPTVTRLTVVHDLSDAPAHSKLVSGDDPQAGGGWPYVLSDLKSIIETGEPLMEWGR